MDSLQRRLLRLALASLTLAALVIALALTGTTDGLDRAMMLAASAEARALPEVTPVMRAASWLGDGWARSLVALAFIVVLLTRRFARAASYILYTALGIAALNAWLLKPLFARPRPDIVARLAEVNATLSLPSGHAANSAAVFGAIALVASAIWWRRGQRRAIWSAAALIVLIIGVSRVWLGLHWPSDVLAGWLVGAGWALLLAAWLKPVQARASPPPRAPV